MFLLLSGVGFHAYVVVRLVSSDVNDDTKNHCCCFNPINISPELTSLADRIPMSSEKENTSDPRLALQELQNASAQDGKEWTDEEIINLISEYRRKKSRLEAAQEGFKG